MPARFLRQPRSAGYQNFLFHDLRESDPAFVLDRPGYRGEVVWTQEELDAVVAQLDAAGWQIAVHTGGDGALDMILDEGISVWIDEALANGFVPLDLDQAAIAHLTALGWRAGPLNHGRFSHLPAGHMCIDFSGWPLYCSASLPEATAYEICGAFGARHDEMPWEAGTHEGLGQIGVETDATPMDVPLHAGAERWYREHGLLG